jgi:prolyl oligopeptidase
MIMSHMLARYPHAERLDITETRHGVVVEDPYRWLEDPADPRTPAWLVAQERLFTDERATWRVEDWKAGLTSLFAVDVASPPVIRREKTFFTRQRAGEEHPTLLVERVGEERPLLNPHDLDPSGRTVLESWRPSAEGDLLAYQLSVDGTEDSQLRVMDVATGQVVDGPIDRVRRSPIAWLPGGTHYYYVRRLAPELHPGEERYHRRVYLHRVGSDPAEDVLIFGEGRDKTQFYSVDVTHDGRWLQISATIGTARSTDLWLADLAESPLHAPMLRPVQEGVDARTKLHIAAGTDLDDPLWLRTTRGASFGRIMTVTPAALDAGWRELVPERPGAVLADFAVMTGPELRRPLGLVAWTRHAISEITVHDLADGRQLGTVPLPGSGTVAGLVARRDGGHEAWFIYTDHRTPPTVLHYDGRTGDTRPWYAAGTGLACEGVRAGHVAFDSRDGTTIRMFIVSPTGGPDRPRPAILTGYGGFGVSMRPEYSPEVLAWVRAGGVFAVACLRGGGEEGQEWHDAGRKARKQNVFDDFDAATDYLIDAGWTSQDRLGIMGGSNGGLLVGAALVQHPGKYAAVVCMSPLLDMARYELSGLGPSWRPEYGSAEDPAEFRALLSYSPYHHVGPGTEYPPVLFTAAEGDTRVAPLHAMKMCAALQHTSGHGPVLLRYERGVGHGARALSHAIALVTDCLAFLADRLGLERDLERDLEKHKDRS